MFYLQLVQQTDRFNSWLSSLIETKYSSHHFCKWPTPRIQRERLPSNVHHEKVLSQWTLEYRILKSSIFVEYIFSRPKFVVHKDTYLIQIYLLAQASIWEADVSRKVLFHSIIHWRVIDLVYLGVPMYYGNIRAVPQIYT